MSHLQECQLFLEPMLPAQDWCICQQLRACEQRVREEWYEAQSEAWDQGYMYGLRKAVQIIKDQPTKRQEYWVYIRRNETLAAIDALREKPWPPLPPSKGVPTTPMWPLRKEKP